MLTSVATIVGIAAVDAAIEDGSVTITVTTCTTTSSADPGPDAGLRSCARHGLDGTGGA